MSITTFVLQSPKMTEKTFYRRLFFIFLLILATTPFSGQGFAAKPEKQDPASAPPDFPKREKETRAAFRGRVLKEDGQPLAHVSVTLSSDSRANIRTTTDANGVYSFSGIPSQPYDLRIAPQRHSSPVQPSAPRKVFSCSDASFSVRPRENGTGLVLEKSHDGLSRQAPEGIVTKVLLPRIVKIEAVYQPDGSTDFNKRNVVRNQYGLSLLGNEWVVNGKRMLRDHVAFDPAYAFKESPGDLLVNVKDGKYSFRPAYGETIGFYALGRGDFNAVGRADPEKIQRNDSPCELNHVYVVRTRQGCYAKFVVRSIEVLDPRKAVSVRFVR